MNASKYLASAVAAVTVVGAIGFAYAQNTYDSNRATGTTQSQNQITPSSSTSADPSMQNQRESDTTDATANTSTNTRDMSGERMARADRN